MSKDDYRIWSNADLDYEEWKDWIEEEYPTLSEDERVAMMYEEILCIPCACHSTFPAHSGCCRSGALEWQAHGIQRNSQRQYPGLPLL